MRNKPTDGPAAAPPSGRHASLGLAAIALLCFLPGFFALPAVDRDEARFAQATRQMVASGDWIDIRLQQEPRYRQPIGIYWLQSAFVAPLGTDGTAPIWVHRLPSILGATLSVLLTYWIALPLIGGRAALLAGAAMAASLILGVEARLAKTDAVLLATILLAQGVLVRAYLASGQAGAAAFAGRKSWLYPLLFWTAIGVGTLVKGPLAILFVGLTAASLAAIERSVSFLRPLRPLPGVVWSLALILPWYVAIGIRTDGAFYETAIGFSVMGKISQGQEGHGAPPLTHLALFWATFWPGSLLFALALAGIWRRRREAWLRFLYCWTVPAWIVFEIVTTKLPHYLLPAFPAIAIATAGILTSRRTIVRSPAARRIVEAVALALGIAMIAAIVAAAWFAGGRSLSPRLVVLGLLALAGIGAALGYALRALKADDIAGFAGGLIAGSIAFFWLFYPSAARIEALWPAARVAEIVASRTPCETPHLVSAGYSEPSLVFNTRTDLVLANGKAAAESLAGRQCAIAIVEARQLTAFLERAREMHIALDPIGSVSGFNIGGGRRLDISVFAARQQAGG